MLIEDRLAFRNYTKRNIGEIKSNELMIPEPVFSSNRLIVFIIVKF